MNTNLTENDISKIKDSLKTLDFPLLGEPRKIETGYEIVIGLEHKKRIAKKTIKALLQSKQLLVLEIDVFLDKCGHYAYALINPIHNEEVTDGRI